MKRKHGNMLDPQYKTGNPKYDEKIEAAFRKNPLKQNQWQRIIGETFNVLAEVPMPRNKYGVAARQDRTYKDGTVFASKREMERWDYLLKLRIVGEITDLKMQVPFILQEEFISKQYGDIHSLTYVADFVYTNISFRKAYPNRICVEDSKGGVRTPEYKIKRKLFLYKFADLLFFEV